MKKFLKIFAQTKFFETIQDEIILGKFFHANFFTCEDELSNFEFSNLVAMSLVCEKHEPCGKCGQCVKVLAQSHPDVFSFGTDKKFVVQDAEKILEQSYIAPMIADRKVFVLNNFDRATPQAMNKILKILEEPPKNVYFILNATNMDLVLSTIKSRCVTRLIPPLTEMEIRQVCEDVFSKEMPKAYLTASGGYFGNAEKLLKNDDFEKSYTLALETLTKLKTSKDVLSFSLRFSQDKQTFILKLSILMSFMRDLLMIVMGEDGLVQNVGEQNLLKSVAKEYNADALHQIIEKIDMAKKQSEANVSQSLIADKLLLSMLEVKYICKQ